MKTLRQMDAELERLSKLHQRVWGEICQLQAERNLALQQLAKEVARNEPAVTYQMSESNNYGHVNNNLGGVEEVLARIAGRRRAYSSEAGTAIADGRRPVVGNPQRAHRRG